MLLDELLSRLDGVRRTANGWSARCPAHDDRRPSLSVARGEDGRILLFCHAGCPLEEILGTVGLCVRDLFPNSSRPRRKWRGARQRQSYQREGLRADVIREARKLIDAAGGIDTSTWSDDRLDRELNRLADAYSILEEWTDE